MLLKYLILLSASISGYSSVFSQPLDQIAFLKTGLGTVIIEETELYKEKIVVDENSYVLIISVDGDKAKVFAWGKRIVSDSDGIYSAVTGHIYMDALILFHKLTPGEQRIRIENSFNAYSKYLSTESYADGNKGNFIYESRFSPMRDAFIDYWRKTKEPELLKKYFAVVKLNDGGADGGDSRALRDLFLSDPGSFTSTWKKLPGDLRKYIKYRVSDAAGWLNTDEQTEYSCLIEKHLKRN